MSATNERALVVTEMVGMPAGIVATPAEALAGLSVSESTFTQVQEAIENLGENSEVQAKGYIDLAWGLLMSGKNPDPFIYHAHQSATRFIEEKSKGRGGFLNSDKGTAYEIDTRIAELAAKRKLALAPEVIDRVIQTIDGYECKMSGVGGADLLSKERFNSNEVGQYIFYYSLEVAPALIRLASVIHDNPDSSELDSIDIAKKAEDILFDKRVRKGWPSSSLAQAGELMIGFYISIGDIESVERVYAQVLDNVRDDTGFGNNFERDLVRTKTMVASFNAQLAGSVNLENLSNLDLEEVLVTGNSAAQRALGRILSPNISNNILQREDLPNDVKRNIIDGLEEKLRADEASVRATRLLLDSKRKEFTDRPEI